MRLYYFTLFLSVHFAEATATVSNSFFYWNEKYLIPKVNIRLVKREWRPLGPSSNTDKVLDEYEWNVDSAFKSLFKSSYEYETSPLVMADSLLLSSEYDQSLDSILVIHPIFATADVFFVKTTINALAMRNLHKKYNVFAVDMPYLNIQMMFTVLRNTVGLPTMYEPIANILSSFLVKGINRNLMKPRQIHLIGWSYSGHLVGYMGRYIDLLYGEKIGSILSLDPYSNGMNKDLMHVSAADAKVVHIYHSNSMMGGTRERVGTADFVFNNGIVQPECSGVRVLRNTIPEPMICSHLKVVQRFWYVILYPSKFVALQCDSWNRFTDCMCENGPAATMSYPIIPNEDVRGIYYIRTMANKPYGVGVFGSTCSSEKRAELRNKQIVARLNAKVPDQRTDT